MRCKICGRDLQRSDFTATELDDPKKAVYHDSMGGACLSHEGIKEHFEELLKKIGENGNGSEE